jgi:hypothetical protein
LELDLQIKKIDKPLEAIEREKEQQNILKKNEIGISYNRLSNFFFFNFLVLEIYNITCIKFFLI